MSRKLKGETIVFEVQREGKIVGRGSTFPEPKNIATFQNYLFIY